LGVPTDDCHAIVIGDLNISLCGRMGRSSNTKLEKADPWKSYL